MRKWPLVSSCRCRTTTPPQHCATFVPSGVTEAIERHLTHEPTKISKSRIKRLRGLSQPQYRLRVGDIRVCSMTLQKRKSKSSRSSPKRTPTRGSGSTARRSRARLRVVALAQVRDDLSKYLRLAADEEIVITRHGRPAGILVGFASEDDWLDYRLEHHPDFLRRIAEARTAMREGRGIRLEDLG